MTANDSAIANPQPAHGSVRWRVIFVTSLLAAAGLSRWMMRSGPTLPNGVSQARYERAAAEFRSAYHKVPEHADVLMVTAELAVQNNEPEVAVAAFGAVSDGHPKYGLSARLQEAQVMMRLNLAAAAERSFRRFLTLAESRAEVSASEIHVARKWLCFLLSVQLRLEERRVILAALHQGRRIDVMDSKQYFFPRLLIWKSSTGRARLDDFLAQDPHNFLLNIALAGYLTGEGRLDESRSLLDGLLQEFPDDQKCLAALLECCYEQNDWEQIADTLKSVPVYRESEPQLMTWIRAEWALHEQRWEDAVTEFRNALRSDPSNPAAQMGLARAFGHLQQSHQQQAAQQRSLVLSQIRVEMAAVSDQSVDPALALAEQCRRIGMDDAATVFEWHAERIRRQLASPNRRHLP